MAGTAIVDVKSAWFSKINWTQAIGIGATTIALLTANKIQIPVDTQVAMVAVIQGIQAIVTWIIKTWFTPTVTTASIAPPTT